MTVFDYAFLGLLGMSMLIGGWRGFVSEVFALVGWAVAVFLAWHFAGTVAVYLVGHVSVAWMRWLAAFLLIFVSVLLILAILRFLFRELLSLSGLRPVDRFLGACFGIARGVVIAFLAVAVGGLTALPKETWWREAAFAPPLETAVIAAKPRIPKELAERIKYR